MSVEINEASGNPGRARSRFPDWLKKRLSPDSELGSFVQGVLRDLSLETVCKNAHCPNQAECYGRGTATFMILGDTCTRSCGFCAVKKGLPTRLEEDEPERVAEAAKALGLRHVVVTSVTRDDLSDGGADHFARTTRAIRAKTSATIEVLTPDFRGSIEALSTVIGAGPDIFNHNVETVPSLYDAVRPEADYERSLHVLALAKELDGSVLTKSGLMVGLGEKKEEVLDTLARLRKSRCDIVTIGQYLAPSKAHAPIAEFVRPEVFRRYEEYARGLGFLAAYAGPFVRSSYNAGVILDGIRSGPLSTLT